MVFFFYLSPRDRDPETEWGKDFTHNYIFSQSQILSLNSETLDVLLGPPVWSWTQQCTCSMRMNAVDCPEINCTWRLKTELHTGLRCPQRFLGFFFSHHRRSSHTSLWLQTFLPGLLLCDGVVWVKRLTASIGPDSEDSFSICPACGASEEMPSPPHLVRVLEFTRGAYRSSVLHCDFSLLSEKTNKL